VGSTFIRTLERYTRDLQAHGNIILLEGINQQVWKQLERTDLIDLIGEENIFLGQARFGAALRDALAAAEIWMVQNDEAG
jgi:SulP family sulfate permease